MNRTNLPLHVVVGLGHDDAIDAETLLESARVGRLLPSCVLHLVHVITPAEHETIDADSTLERLDRSLVRERDRIDALVRRTLGAYPAALEMHVDVVFGRHRHLALEEAARRHAASLVIVHAHEGDEPTGLPNVLAREAPCSVLVVRPRSTPQRATPLVEPPPAPGEPLRARNAVSRTHVVVPSEPRDRKRDFADSTGSL